MAFGDYLRNHIDLLSKASIKKVGSNAFWKILQEIAVHEILELYPQKVDSDVAVPVYYQILKENEDIFNNFFKEKIPSNNQERYRVLNRNMWTSNALHLDGIANRKEIKAVKIINEERKGRRIIYQGVEEYANKQ